MSIRAKIYHATYTNLFLTYQLVGAVIHLDFGWPRLASFLVAIVADALLRSALRYRQDLHNLKDMIDHLKEFPDCIYQEVEIDNLVSENVKNSLSHPGVTSRQVNKWLKVYHVKARGNNEMPFAFPNADLAFYGRSTATIFLISSPNPQTPQQKFKLLHELGHVARNYQSMSYREMVLGAPIGCIMMWAFLQRAPEIAGLWVYFLLLLIMHILQTKYDMDKRAKNEPINEAVADAFALKNMSHEDRVAFADYVMGNFERRFPPDRGQYAFRKLRSLELKKGLSTIQAKRDEELTITINPHVTTGVWWIGMDVILVASMLSPPVTTYSVQVLALFVSLFFFTERGEWWQKKICQAKFAKLFSQQLQPSVPPQQQEVPQNAK